MPGVFGTEVSDDWIHIQNLFDREASLVAIDKPRYATVCLSAEAMRSRLQIEHVLSTAESWNVEGYYVVAEHPSNQYLVEDPVWLSNLLLLCGGLRLHRRTVIAAYSAHQSICLAAANVDAIASGTFLNVRSFSTDKFILPDEETTSRRAVWYYCPHALSEYKLQFLDMGYRAGVLDELRPASSIDGGYADVIFSGADPSATAFREAQAFRHYLYCLNGQAESAKKSTFRDTVDEQLRRLSDAVRNIDSYRKIGILGQGRDFADIVEVNEAALTSFNSELGFTLERQW